MASTFIWARRCIPTQKESTFSDPTGSSPTCVKIAVRINQPDQSSIINRQCIMKYSGSIFMGIIKNDTYNDINPFDLERFLVCDENLPKKRKNDENL
jgi:hypothetical protein